MAGKKIYLLLFMALSALMLSWGCRQKQERKDFISKPEYSFLIKGSVREMEIGPEMPEFPQQDGKTEFTAYCSMCHSLKYISMQPDFPRKTWEAEVTKMIVKYKAPIDSTVSKKIVDYLVKIKSKPEGK